MKRRIFAYLLAAALLLALCACGGKDTEQPDDPQAEQQGVTLRVANNVADGVYRIAIEYPAANGTLGSLASAHDDGSAFAGGEQLTFALSPQDIYGLQNLNFTLYAYGADGNLLYTATSEDWQIAPGGSYDFGFGLDATTGTAGLSRDIVG